MRGSSGAKRSPSFRCSRAVRARIRRSTPVFRSHGRGNPLPPRDAGHELSGGARAATAVLRLVSLPVSRTRCRRDRRPFEIPRALFTSPRYFCSTSRSRASTRRHRRHPGTSPAEERGIGTSFGPQRPETLAIHRPRLHPVLRAHLVSGRRRKIAGNPRAREIYSARDARCSEKRFSIAMEPTLTPAKPGSS